MASAEATQHLKTIPGKGASTRCRLVDLISSGVVLAAGGRTSDISGIISGDDGIMEIGVFNTAGVAAWEHGEAPSDAGEAGGVSSAHTSLCEIMACPTSRDFPSETGHMQNQWHGRFLGDIQPLVRILLLVFADGNVDV